MNSVDILEVLNHLLVLHHRSLPTYLADATPWVDRGREPVLEVLNSIVRDQIATVERLGKLILDGGGAVRLGEFPLRYTAYNDISLDYLLPLLIEQQKRLVSEIESDAGKLSLAPHLQPVAQEILGAAKGHLESLLECRQQPTSTTA